MKESKYGYLVEPIRELLYNYEEVLNNYKKANGVKFVGFNYELLPPDVLASFGLYYLRLPSVLYGDGNLILNDVFNVYEYLVFNEQDKLNISKENSVFYLEKPIKYGEELSVKLHEQIDEFLKFAGVSNGMKSFDLSKLQIETEKFDNTRRLIRGISGIRKSKPHLLSNRDLFDVLESVSVFPPETTIIYLENLYNHMISDNSKSFITFPHCLLHSKLLRSSDLYDQIEEMGIIIDEDDSYNGRRFYDLSFNSKSEYLYYEMLDAYSYKAFAPGVRDADERFELFYKLLRNHNIEFVLFLEDKTDNLSDERNILRKKLMRSGVDPLIVNIENLNEIQDYVDLMKKKIKKK